VHSRRLVGWWRSFRAHLDFRGTIARAGVAVFAITLLMPMVLLSATRDLLVANAHDIGPTAGARAEFAPPNHVAGAARRLAAPQPTLAPSPSVESASDAAVTHGDLVTASWYGPGFYENRLPCWPWLTSNGLPIQFLPDTWGVAHKTLPCGTMLVLTHGANTITVPVVDRGPYVVGREIDMSPRIKAALGCTDICTVLMQVQ
jgi:rare lipoprotein A (peptidoglycan hydrolase)